MPHGKASREKYWKRQAAARKELKKQAKEDLAQETTADESAGSNPTIMPFVIPTVTEDDLLAFQSSHFGDNTRPDTFFVDPSQALSCSAIAAEDVDDDDLGWYDDGVKRTLTVDQIAIFRHSEMSALQQPQKLATPEALENEEVPQATDFQQGAVDHYSPESSLEPELVRPAKTANPDSKKSKRTKNRQPSQSSRSTSTRSSMDPSRPPRRREEVPYDQRHKRKWEDFIEENDPTQGSITHRRMVRELDVQKNESVDLDY